MTDAHHAKLAFLTDPEPGVVLLNVQVEGEDELQRFKLNRDQLFILNKDTADILVKAFK